MLSVKNISKTYSNNSILNNIDLEVAHRKTLSILGKSGCGKTTLLKIIAGLVEADDGSIRVKEDDITKMTPQKRGIIYLFQEAMLFPHLNVFNNMSFGLEIAGVPKLEIREKVTHFISELGLAGLEGRMPEELSGGQKQRVAFGRALILSPKILLLDEPFGNLDAVTREEMQALYKKVAREHKITSIFVTHDVKEALTVGQAFAIMENGKLDIFHDKKDFLQDPRSGAGKERSFWTEQYSDGSQDQ